MYAEASGWGVVQNLQNLHISLHSFTAADSNLFRYNNLLLYVSNLKFAGLRAMGVQVPLPAPFNLSSFNPNPLFQETLKRLFECDGLLEVSG